MALRGPLALLLVSVCACGPDRPRDLRWELAFADPATEDVTTWIAVEIRRRDCSGAPFWSSGFDPRLRRGDAPPALTPGPWCFFAEARDASCRAIGRGFVEADLPVADGNRIRVSILSEPAPPSACPMSGCTLGRCAGDVRDGGPPRDSGPLADGEVRDDRDRDGVPSPLDCDDSDPTVYPGATETCDGRDEDCDDLIDDGAGCPCVQMNRVPGADGIGHSYIRCAAGMMNSQSMARGVCAAMCGGAADCPYHLVKIEDMVENAYVADNALGAATWIGLELRGGGYVWHDGTVPAYTSWQAAASRTQTCVQLIAGTGEWRDVSCNTNASTFCEAP